MHTEKDAALLWCPHVRLPAQFTVKLNAQPIAIAATATNVEAHVVKQDAMTRLGNNVTCIGSKCSAWRWTRSYRDDKGVERFEPKFIDPDATPAPAEQRIGFCGLAGDPI